MAEPKYKIGDIVTAVSLGCEKLYLQLQESEFKKMAVYSISHLVYKMVILRKMLCW